MSIETVLFYIFASIMVLAAGMVITVRNPVYAALFLVLTFFSCAALWLLLQVEFLAVTLIVVYVGAVMVLFLFVVMMLDINLTPIKEGFARYLPVGLVVALVMAAELLAVIWAKGRFSPDNYPIPAARGADYSNTKAVGEWLYTKYLLPFEIAGVILLVAIVAAIALTLRKRDGVKTQQPSRQIQVRREDRIRMIKMDAERGTDKKE